MSSILNTGLSRVKNVEHFIIGNGSRKRLHDELKDRRSISGGRFLFFVDHFFQQKQSLIDFLPIEDKDEVIFVDTAHEPTTVAIDDLTSRVKRVNGQVPGAIVAVGGGSTMDTAKAISNLLTNEGQAADYQGWDLVTNQSVFKIAVPTIAGTGAEATRTCVMTNKQTGLKLGMNSDYSVFDRVILDPELLTTVPRDQYFYTGMDAYIHCLEAVSGRYRKAVGDALSQQVLNLSKEVFLGGDMMREEAREKLMVASYLGGMAIATSYVGLVHPLSAGLSVVLGSHHCISNCIVMRAMQGFYPKYYDTFWEMAERQSVKIPTNICHGLGQDDFVKLYDASIVHTKPLTNALGQEYKKILSKQVVTDLFMAM